MGYRVRTHDSDDRPIGTVSYPTDAAWERKLRDAAAQGDEAAAAARLEAEEAGAFTHVAPGDDCSDVPEGSREWLLEQGYIEVTEDTASPAGATKKPAKTGAKKPATKES